MADEKKRNTKFYTNKDGVVSISDVVAIVNYVLNGEKKIRVSGGNAAEAHAKKR